MQKVLNKREKTALYLTVGIIVFALGFNFLIAPVLTRNDNLNKEINLSRQKFKKYLQLLSRKESLQKKYSKFLPALGLTKQREEADLGIFSELESLAKEANIKIIDLRPEASGGSRAKEVKIDLRAEGTMEGFLNFIYHLENSLALLKIKEFQLSAKPNSANLEGNFSIAQFSGAE